MVNLRIKCAQTVQSILENKVFFAELKNAFDEKDLPFANMLILTVLRRFTALKQILHGFLSKKIAHKHRLAEYLLLLAIAEILYMQTAEYAVLNETVKNIRNSCDKFLGGMANAVLRKVCTQKDELRQKAETVNPLPPDFVEILKGYDADQIRQIAHSVFNLPPLDLTVKANPQEWAQKLSAELLPNGSLRIYNPPKVQQLPEYNAGEWWVQDAAAALPVAVMGDVAGKKVIDLCAAPGGKTAQLLARGAEVTALDISASRLDTLKQNMARIGFAKVQTVAVDALDYLDTCTEQYDAILLDAPCSATGTFRRHPEILHIKNRTDVAEQAALQEQMLNKCAKILKVGGILVYSVCSIAKAEGELQIARFLEHNSQFKPVKIAPAEIAPCGEWHDDLLLPDGSIRTLPYFLSAQKGMDSFFICKLQRII